VQLVVRGVESLIAPSLVHARAHLESLHHEVRDDAAAIIEIEVGMFDSTVKDGVYRYCARMYGRVIRGGKRFPALDTMKEHCLSERFSNGGVDLLLAPIYLAMDIAKANAITDKALDPQSALYLQALDALIEALSRQASRPAPAQ